MAAKGKRVMDGQTKEKATSLSKNAVSPEAAKLATAKEFPIVCLGSSAGGLDALQRFFKALPESSGAAYILISHLDPNHISLLPELMRSCAKDPVKQIEDGMLLKKDTVYVIPPNSELTILKRRLHLLPPSKQAGPRLVIDTFLRALALDQKNNAVCIILSGTGSDGSLGLQDIHHESGIVMVQDPDSAQFNSMPHNAIQTNLADVVSPPEQLPEQLLRHINGRSLQRGYDDCSSPDIASSLVNICAIIHNKTGHNFSCYKQNTICRRIERRLIVHQLKNAEDYVRFLSENPNEAEMLFQELLIGVTSFFRDPDHFNTLRDKALEEIIRNKSEQSPIRVWVPGCSTGEEAYSIAILIQECLDNMERHLPVQIFATDIDEKAIDTARQGQFPLTILADVSPERLRQHFVLENGAYFVKKDVRGMVTFAPHDILKDPPFSKLDLICCRNLMIYLDSASQKNLMSVFHYSLHKGGYLFLGGSESVGDSTDLFCTIDQKHKLFRRQPVKPSPSDVLSFAVADNGISNKCAKTARLHDFIEPKLFHRIERFLIERYAPASVIVDSKGEIVYVIQGDTGNYLELAHGDAQMNVFQMAKCGIRGKIAKTLNNAIVENKRVSVNSVQLETESGHLTFNLIVEPISDPRISRRLYLILFETASDTKPCPPSGFKTKATKAGDPRLLLLEDELRTAKEDLQATIEIMESSHEELKSTNEELQSTNEELQSSNEELVTSKEEMQSLNEELSTVNAENEARISEMTKAFDDIRNLLNCTPFATVFVDCDLRIRRFTPTIKPIMNFIETDIHRPLQDITTKLDYANMVQDVKQVLDTLNLCEREVDCIDGRTFIMRILPYRTVANVIDGAVIAFIDISDRKKLSRLNQLYVSILQSSTNAMMLFDRDGKITVWNKAAETLYGWTESDIQTMTIQAITSEVDRDRFIDAIDNVYRRNGSLTLDIQRLTKTGATVPARATLTRVADEQNVNIGIACSECVVDSMPPQIQEGKSRKTP